MSQLLWKRPFAKGCKAEIVKGDEVAARSRQEEGGGYAQNGAGPKKMRKKRFFAGEKVFQFFERPPSSMNRNEAKRVTFRPMSGDAAQRIETFVHQMGM